MRRTIVLVFVALTALVAVVFVPLTNKSAGAYQEFPCPPDQGQIENLRRNADAARLDAQAPDIGFSMQSALLATAAEFDQMASEWLSYCASQPAPTIPVEEPVATQVPTVAPPPTEAIPVPTATPQQPPRPTPSPIPAPTVFEGFYPSPNWGYTVSWDPDIWRAMESPSATLFAFPSRAETRELLVLTNGRSELTMAGFALGGDSAATSSPCLDRILTAVKLTGNAMSFFTAKNADGAIRGVTDAGVEYGLFTFRIPSTGENRVAYLECRLIQNEQATFAVMIDVPREVANEDVAAGLQVVESLLVTIRPTPTPVPSPTPEVFLDPHA